MKVNLLLTLLTLQGLVSCDNSKPRTIKSFELTYSKDTVNIIDSHNRKQGVWITGSSTDTLVYLNDTGYSTKGTTARKLIDSLNKKGK